MKKIFLALLLISSLAVSAQWNNSWIDYSKTYYKFQLANDTLTRIPQSVLAGLGLDAVNAILNFGEKKMMVIPIKFYTATPIFNWPINTAWFTIRHPIF